MGASDSCAKSTTSSPPTLATAPTTVAPTVPPATTPPATLLQLTGSGTKQTASFNVTHEEWTIAYNFNCTAFANGTGNFNVEVTDPAGGLHPGLAPIVQLAAIGNNSTVEHGAGTYYLSITSECNWGVTVTG